VSTLVGVEAWWRRPKLSPAEENMIAAGRTPRPKGPEIQLWLDKPLVEWPERGCRFAITGTGRVVTGDPATVLHVDMVKGSGAFREGDPLVAGCVVPYRRAWTMYAVQNFVVFGAEGGQATQDLLARLTTWAAFIGTERVFWPEKGEFGSEFYERLDRENPVSG
jgi:hypothetical protein